MVEKSSYREAQLKLDRKFGVGGATFCTLNSLHKLYTLLYITHTREMGKLAEPTIERESSPSQKGKEGKGGA